MAHKTVFSLGAAVAGGPFRRAVVVEPFRPVAEEEAHQNRAGVEVCQPTRHRAGVKQLYSCVVMKVQAAVLVVLVVAGPHLQQLRQGREECRRAGSQRTSDRSAGHSPLRLKIVH
ncbi:hypothetical protein RBB79_00180 [Tunturiibacter empetritectus]|uniref:Uncharacterized protein n=1 Tax=Tunturiibacter lichenicola TaxID=2051959 RepID=A0A852VM52_9BACT|nr:hypothetical protein [Edaphobacter lichenicola]NYF92241.1 hypothetical protein [Edaphobacter lichenicola]